MTMPKKREISGMPQRGQCRPGHVTKFALRCLKKMRYACDVADPWGGEVETDDLAAASLRAERQVGIRHRERRNWSRCSRGTWCGDRPGAPYRGRSGMGKGGTSAGR